MRRSKLQSILCTIYLLKLFSKNYTIFTTKFKECLDLALPKSGNIKKDNFMDSFINISSLSLESIEDTRRSENKIT